MSWSPEWLFDIAPGKTGGATAGRPKETEGMVGVRRETMGPLEMKCDAVRVLKGPRELLGGFWPGECGGESEVSLEQ